MEKTTIRCPKCSHEQTDTVECASCGLIFARYQRHIERQQEKKTAGGAERGGSSGGSGLKIAAVVLLMLATAGVTYYLVRPGGEQPAPQVETARPQQPPAAPPPPAETGPAPAATAAGQGVAVVKGSSIEEARNATVSLETPWGTGSGFFVNKHYIVTNRHVIEVDEQALAEARSKVETVRKLVELEQQKLEQLRQEMRKLPEGPTRKQLALILQAREGELAKVLPQLEEGEERLAAMEKGVHASDIKIILADGREFQADFLQVSSRHDLALLALHAVESPYLRRDPKARPLQQGEKVFTIGSPVGLRHTVTSGIFSGYRERTSDGNVLLQTDAPINPGNSGGPLIDEKGYVFGVNTMILRDTEGIGFAIPIEAVYEDFMTMLR
jgi:S1-C subfamily serine protease/ribosomal protein L37E